MFPAVVVVKIPVGIKVIYPPPVDIGDGAVIVAIAATPLINVIAFVGATVDALAIVGAAADVANTSVNFGEVKVGVEIVGVVIVGEVANTADPVPVSSVKAVRKLTDEGVAKKLATPAPRPATPVEIGRPVQLVNTPEDGVPIAGVTNVGDV
jgi:hypothetical protein